MQYSGAQGNASSSGYALQMKGGGVIPPVLLEECRVPRFYKDAIASCGATNPSQLPNTTAVYNLMVASGLPRPMLSYIWTIVNRTLPGQLTRQEFYSCLALIALAQKGQTLCALSSVSTLPVPQLQLPGQYGNQSKQGQPTGSSATAASTPSLNLFGNVSPSSSSQQPASTIPTSISVQNFGRKQFPSPAETAALSFTRSLDMRSSQRAAAALSSNKQVVNVGASPDILTGGMTGPMKSSQSIPATMNFASSPAPSSVPVTKAPRKASSELDEMFSDVKVKTTPIAGSEQGPFGHKSNTLNILESSVSKPNSCAVNPLDDLFDISLPSTSSKSQKPLVEAASRGTSSFNNASEATAATSQPSQNKPSPLLDDEFGEMTVPTQSATTPSTGLMKLGSEEKFLGKPTTNEKSDSFDVYAAVKMVEGGSGNREDTERTELWKRCIDEAYGSFEHAEKNLLSHPKEAIEAVAQTKRGSRYILALEKIFEMVTRISRGREAELADKAEILKSIGRIWERLKAYVYFSATSPRTVSNGLILKKCEICLSEIAEEALLEFAGNVYHKQCANFWINRIYPVLPKLS